MGYQMQAVDYSVGFSVIVPPYEQHSELVKKVNDLANPNSEVTQHFNAEMQANGVTVESIVLTQPPISVNSVILRDASGAILNPQLEAYKSVPVLATTTTAPRQSSMFGIEDDDSN